MNCEHAQTTLSADSQGRSWEHFWLGDRYQFSNQIPNLKSFTRTDPGWVLNDNRYCDWAGEPPERIRTEAPIVAQQLAGADAPISPIMATDAGMTSGGFGVLVLLAAVAAGGWYLMQRGKEPDPNYHPMGDLDYRLPALSVASKNTPQVDSVPDEIEWEEGDPIPPGYEFIDDDEEAEEECPKFERSPFLPEALKQQIEAEAQAAARHQTQTAFMQGLQLAERVYPYSRHSQPAPPSSPVSLVQPAIEVVEQPVRQPVAQPVEAAEVEMFEEVVKAFTPLPLNALNGTTQEAVKEALRLGKSQNWITANLFEVSKGTRDYEQAVSIIKGIRG